MIKGTWTSLYTMSSEEAGQFLQKTKTVVMPFGSTEHHGPHLPLGTDSMQAVVVAKKLAEKVPVLVTPLIPVGVDYYFMSWPGTITIEIETYARLIEEMTLSLVRHGVKNFVYLSGHGGNKQALELAAINSRRKADIKVLIAVPAYVANVLFQGKYDMGHGGRIETDGVLVYNSELVDMQKAMPKPGQPTPEEQIQRISKIRGRARYDIFGVVKDFRQEVSEEGWFGDAKGATIEEGQFIFDRVTDEIIEHMKRMFGEI
ncbi:MAG: creatininase family protein [Chloroflexi bacterium]|nr:creatininase family protein [Chloroflexota bacterium]